MPDEITFDVVKNWFEANKNQDEAKAYFSAAFPAPKVSVDSVKEFLNTSEGKEILTPLMKSYGDSRVTEAIKTHDKNWELKLEEEVSKRTEEKIHELYPQEEPWKQEIRKIQEESAKATKEIQDKLQKAEAEKEQERLRAEVMSLANDMKVDPWVVKKIKVASVDEAKDVFNEYAAFVKEHDEKIKNEIISNGAMKPGGGNPPVTQVGGKLNPENMSQEDWVSVIEKGELDKTLAKLK